MINDLVSIALATYNGEKYLREQLDSICKQTYQNIEIIVSDDCSTDKTLKILDEYKIKCGLKYIVNNTNKGFVKNFENAINLSTGKYIALCDQDDIWLPEKIETLLKNIDDNILIHSDAFVINTDNYIINNSHTKFSKKTIQFQDTKDLLFWNTVNGCMCLFKRELLEHALPFPENIPFHDWWLAIIASKIGKIKYLDIQLLKYRQHNNNNSGKSEHSTYNDIVTTIKKGWFETQCNTFIQNLSLNKNLLQLNLIFTKEEKKIISDLIIYYNSYFDNYIRFKGFAIHFKYFKYFRRDNNLFYRILRLLNSLIGINKKCKNI